jgi:hypothetical protein
VGISAHVTKPAACQEVMASVRQDFTKSTEALMPSKPAQVLSNTVDERLQWLKEVRMQSVGGGGMQACSGGGGLLGQNCELRWPYLTGTS